MKKVLTTNFHELTRIKKQYKTRYEILYGYCFEALLDLGVAISLLAGLEWQGIDKLYGYTTQEIA